MKARLEWKLHFVTSHRNVSEATKKFTKQGSELKKDLENGADTKGIMKAWKEANHQKKKKVEKICCLQLFTCEVLTRFKTVLLVADGLFSLFFLFTASQLPC